MKTSSLAPVAALAGLALLAGCSSGPGSDETTAGAAISVVASTNVWGDVVEQVGGDLVSVTSIVDDPSADPHSFEANAQAQLALSKADLVVENGGGYDDFVDTMLSALDGKPLVVNAVDVSGKAAADGGELNEHVWYDFGTVAKVADQVAAQLGAIDPDSAATFEANAAAFGEKIDGLTAKAEAIKADHGGAGVTITEPVPLYLIEAAGLVDKTPEEFSEAIEDETDVPATVLKEMLDLFTDGSVAALVYNAQTTGPQTEQVLAAAKAAGIAVVPVTETLPEGEDYVSWMTGNLDNLAAALGS
jgi:zinc/manganese transport system substrate-binding protein